MQDYIPFIPYIIIIFEHWRAFHASMRSTCTVTNMRYLYQDYQCQISYFFPNGEAFFLDEWRGLLKALLKQPERKKICQWIEKTV